MAIITIPEEGIRGTLVIYGNLQAFNFFLETPLEPDEFNVGRERRQKSNKSTTVRRGPSDLTGFTRASSTSDYCYDPTLKSGNALPGREIVMWVDPKSSEVREKRQFTLKGRALDFQEYFNDKMKYDTWVNFAEGGSHYFVKAQNDQG
jgi:hypothetical protein